jgi:prophage regulatory protein
VTNPVARPVGGDSAAGSAHTSHTLLALSVVLQRVPLSKASVYAMMAKGTFPKPLKAGSRSLWLEHEVDAWITALAEQRDAAA